jgi:hypothetical protein
LRFRLLLTLIAGGVALGGSGCGEDFNAGPLRYIESERLTSELKDRPKLQAKVRQALVDLYGPDPRNITVPAGTGLPYGGVYLANHLP